MARCLSKVYKFLFLLILCSFLGFSQTPINSNFSGWNKASGLPSNSINALVKDEFGFLWIATNDGLCRFNGPNSFKIYRYEKEAVEKKNSLESNFISSLYYDSENYLWIGTRNGGLTKFHPKKNTWNTYLNDTEDKNSISNNSVLSILEDSKKRIWIGTEDGLNLFNKTTEKFTFWNNNDINSSSLISKTALSIMEDKNGWLWAGTWASGLYLLLEDENGNINPNSVRQFKIPSSKSANNVWALHQDDAGRFWLGTHGEGVALMSLPENASNKLGHQKWEPSFDMYKFSYPGSKNKSSDLIQALHQDKLGDFWVGSCHGLYKVSAKNLSAENADKTTLLSNYEVFIPSGEEMMLPGEATQYILEDEQGLIWIGTSDGLNQFNRHSNQFKSATFQDENLRLLYAPCIAVDANKNIWISSASKGISQYKIEHKKLKKTNHLNDLILGKAVQTINIKDERWIYAGTEEGITSIDLQTKKSKKYPFPNWVKNKIEDVFITNILADRHGFIWVGTLKGLIRINTKNKKHEVFLSDKSNPNSLSDSAITSIIEDIMGNIWIATYLGLNRISDLKTDSIKFENFYFNKETPKKSIINNRVLSLKQVGQYLYIGTDKGICGYDFIKNEFEDLGSIGNNYAIRSIEEGINNDIWLSTSEGILNFNKENGSYKLFDKKDGLGNTSYRLGASYKDEDNNIYFASVNGITYFSPENFLVNETVPPVHITDIEISSRNGERYLNGIHQTELELYYDDYRLSIEYAALNYNRADKNKFAYRLVGLENDWTEIKFGVPIIYTNLKPDEYRLEVKACNNDGFCNNKGTFLTITKHPPYWQTWWFRILTLLTLVALIFLIINTYTSNVRKRNETLKAYNHKLNTEVHNRKKAEQKLQSFNTELKRSNKDLEQFAYIASHDLKEPLRVIGGFSKLLEKNYEDKGDVKELKYLDFINGGIERMTNLINSLLTYSRVGQKDDAYETFDLHELINGKVTDLSKLIEDKNGLVKIEKLPKIIGQKEQIGMVFYNLINNALKFNTKPQPTVLVKQELTDDDSYWKFSIKDNGIGIEPQYQEQIFGLFKRLHNKNDFEGTGIGLSVCQKIIFRHEGKIWLESISEEGTTFFFTIKKNLSNSNTKDETQKKDKPQLVKV